MTEYEIQVCSELLKVEYAKAASARKGAKLRTSWLIKPTLNVFIDALSKELGDYRLAKLFIEAQFSTFPIEWCLQNFKIPYPPVNSVFRGNCWERYLEYLNQGVREPV